MKILVTGANGLIGTALCNRLKNSGHQVLTMGRSENSDFQWDPEKGVIPEHAFAGVEGVVHLAGEPIAALRWTKAKKERIKSSRVLGTSLISETLSGAAKKPKVFVSASAIGIYGNPGQEVQNYASPRGKDFLAEVCSEWEQATKAAKSAGIRTVCARFGVVLAKQGGALKSMLPAFKMGLGGRLGSGQQYMSWIALEDAVNLLVFALENKSLSGAVNVVSPVPVTNSQFTRTLGRTLVRPAIFPMPSFIVRLLFGEMGQSLFLNSCRATPTKALDAGFNFSQPNLDQALTQIFWSNRHHDHTQQSRHAC